MTFTHLRMLFSKLTALRSFVPSIFIGIVLPNLSDLRVKALSGMGRHQGSVKDALSKHLPENTVITKTNDNILLDKCATNEGRAERGLTFYILANAISQQGTMGGNTKIMLEFARRWAVTEEVNVITYEDGLKTCLNYDLNNVNYVMVPSSRFAKFGVPVYYGVQILGTCLTSLKTPKKTGCSVVYSASNFWPDVIPAIIMKRKNPRLKWIGSYYLMNPSAFTGFEEKRHFLPDIRLLASNFMDRVSFVLLLKYADAIFVTNDLDKKFFSDKGFSASKLKAIYGGVNLAEISEVPEQQVKKYDCCFVGRIHPQKGVVYLIDIWDRVHKMKPNAKLAIIGNGPKWYENKVRSEIRKRHLEKNIDMLGFMDGKEKYKILKSSRVFLHTSIYDNCGMAAAEGMACGLPVVRFDIPALKVAYPKGTLVAPLIDCKKFADAAIAFLDDHILYNKIKTEALELVKSWDWNEKTFCLLNFVNTELNTARDR